MLFLTKLVIILGEVEYILSHALIHARQMKGRLPIQVWDLYLWLFWLQTPYLEFIIYYLLILKSLSLSLTANAAEWWNNHTVFTPQSKREVNQQCLLNSYNVQDTSFSTMRNTKISVLFLPLNDELFSQRYKTNT
jgi:hypothetical protein